MKSILNIELNMHICVSDKICRRFLRFREEFEISPAQGRAIFVPSLVYALGLPAVNRPCVTMLLREVSSKYHIYIYTHNQQTHNQH